MIKIINDEKTFALSAEYTVSIGREFLGFAYLDFPITQDEILTPIEFRTRLIPMRNFVIKENESGFRVVCIELPSKAAESLLKEIESLRLTSKLWGLDCNVVLTSLNSLKLAPTEEEKSNWKKAMESAISERIARLAAYVNAEAHFILEMDRRISEL